MGQAGASQAFNTHNKRTIVGTVTHWSVGVTGLAAALVIAGAIVAFSSVKADARPSYVTASKPCGSCHPPNRPPKKK